MVKCMTGTAGGVRLPVLLATALLAGCLSPSAAPEGATPTAATDPAQHAPSLHRAWALAAHDHRELNLDMSVGNEITFSLRMSTPLAWDIHSHTGSAVTLHAEGEGDILGRFTAPADGTYSLFIKAGSVGANVTADVTGAFSEATG